jgi:glycosyltransferase involved in cell wall biosynthesis
MLKLTVVVTNFRRPELLDRCLNSLVTAGIGRVVVSTTCPTPEVEGVIDRYRSSFQEFQIVSTTEDFGCNENWLRGCYFARTPYVLILHDDDWLQPSFGSTYRKTIEPQLDRGVGFASWRGQSVTPSGATKNEDYFEGPTRVMASAGLSKELLVDGRLTISPVLSVFRRNDCIRILKEAEQYLTDPACRTRPTMLVGNDLLLYLRHAEKYSSWLYVNEILTNFGAWPGSETVQAISKKSNPLVPAYDFARKVFRSTRGPAVKLKPRLIHTFSDYPVIKADQIRRHNYALKTWEFQYGKGVMIPYALRDSDFRRSSKDLGDSKPAPFVKDIIQHGMALAAPGDRVVVTNRDTCMVRNTTEVLRSLDAEAAYGVRQDIFYPIEETTAVLDDISTTGRFHCGADLMSISPEWWAKWKDWVPDLVLSYEAWDLMAREIFKETQPGVEVEIKHLVYHEYHETFWAQPENRYAHPVQIYCLRNAKNFYHSRGLTEHYSLAG